MKLFFMNLEVDGFMGMYPIAAKDRAGAMLALRRVVPNPLFSRLVSINEVFRLDDDMLDMALEALGVWFGNCCDHADGNDSVSDADWDEILEIERRTHKMLCKLS